MARYTESVCKLCRREGAKLFLKGERCFSDKCAFERRPYPPGQFGAGRIRISEYGTQLREKQKVKRIYQMTESQFRRMFSLAVRKQGVKSLNFLRMLEMRLDVICYKAGFTNSIKQSRQLISHGHFLVNGKKVTIPSYVCQISDVVQPGPVSRDLLVIKEALENARRRTRPEWLGFDEAQMVSTLSRQPEREDVTLPISEKYIVELYSK
jgi:small subunit ribosomal protein S4